MRKVEVYSEVYGLTPTFYGEEGTIFLKKKEESFITEYYFETESGERIIPLISAKVASAIDAYIKHGW